LTGAQLAHAEHDEPALALRILRARKLDLSGVMGRAQQEAQRGAQARLGELGQRRGDTLERPPARYVRERHEQRGPALGYPEPTHERRPVRVRREIAV